METIILNRMYVGSYLDESENIGHEVINLFKDDNGSNYIYLNESGAIAKTYNDTVKAVLLVKYVEMGVFEVIAKAEGTEWEKGLQQVYYKNDGLCYAFVTPYPCVSKSLLYYRHCHYNTPIKHRHQLFYQLLLCPC